MSKVKVIITAFAVVLVVGAVASASASAATAGWMVNGTLLSGSENLATTAAVSENAKLTGAGVTVECKGKTLNGLEPKISSPSSGSATDLEFTECETVESETCTIESRTIKTVPIKAEATLEGALAVKVVFNPVTGTTFTTIKYLGSKCALLGVKPVTGNANVTAPTGQDERTLQEIKANTAVGLLKIGSANATLKGAANLKLASGKTWSFL